METKSNEFNLTDEALYIAQEAIKKATHYQSLAEKSAVVANKNLISAQFYAEVLARLIQNNQYIIQHMLSEEMDDTQQYRDLCKTTEEAMMLLCGKNPYPEKLI